MRLSLLISALFLPVLFWIAYHYYHDRHRPEPLANLVIALGLGVLASFLAGWGYRALDLFGLGQNVGILADTDLAGLFLFAVFGIGVIEELAKLLPFLCIVLRFRDFDEPLDGIVYASFIALGFAAMENYHYLELLSPNEAIARGFAGPAVHIVFASIWGYRVGVASLHGRGVFRAAAGWLAVAALLHGLYDFIVLAFSGPALVLAAASIIAVWIWRLQVVWELNQAAGGVSGARDEEPTNNGRSA